MGNLGLVCVVISLVTGCGCMWFERLRMSIGITEVSGFSCVG